MSEFQRVGLLGRREHPGVTHVVSELLDLLDGRGIDVVLEDRLATLAHFETHKRELKTLFEKKCLENRDGKRMFATVLMTPGVFIADMVERKCIKDTMVTPTPFVVGDDTLPRHSNLSQPDA